MIHIITGGRSSGKTSALENISRSVENPFGFISCKIKDNEIVTGYDLKNIRTDEKFPFIRDKKNYQGLFKYADENKRYIFNKEVYKYIYEEFFQRKIQSGSFFLDEIGNLEIEHKKGLYEILIRLIGISENNDIYLSVSLNNLPSLLNIINEQNLEYSIIRQKNIAAVIMASGLSVRFGRENKLLKKINGKTVIETVIENVIKADSFSSIVVVSSYSEILEKAEKYWNVSAVNNMHSSRGISESIKKGISALTKQTNDAYMFFPGDQVLLGSETIKKLINEFIIHSRKIIIPLYDGQRGSPVIFPAAFQKQLLSLTDDNGGKEIILNNPSSLFEVQIDAGIEASDIDTIADYDRVTKLMDPGEF